MSKDSRRKLSDFTSFAAIQTPQSDSEDPLFEFEAPKYCNLFQSAKNPSYHHSILDFSIDQRNHDDYWFTYSHYLHEEEDNGDKSTDVSQSTTTQNNNSNQNEVNPMMNQSSASVSEESKSQEIEKPNDHQEKEIHENKAVVVVLKKDEVKQTVGKKVVIGVKKNQQGKENNVAHVNRKTATTTVAKASKKRKEPTSFSSINQLDRATWNTNTLVSKKKVEVKKTTTVTKMSKSASTKTIEPTLKKVKMTEATKKLPEKIDEIIKIDLKKSSLSRIPFKPEARRKTYAEISQKTEKTNNMRHSVSVKHLNNNTLGTTYHVPLGKKSVLGYSLNDKNVTKSVEIKEELTYSQIKVEKEGTTNSNRMLYEPPVHGTRDVRKWEKISGKKWYNLSCHERQIANTEIEKMIKDSSKTSEA